MKNIKTIFYQKQFNTIKPQNCIENEFFIIRLLSINYTFSNKELKEFSSLIIWGGGFYSFFEYIDFPRIFNCELGACFNENLEWTGEIIAIAEEKFNMSYYAGTNYDRNELPLDIAKEIDFKNEPKVFDIDIDEDELDVYLAEHSKWMDLIINSKEQLFEFTTLSELLYFMRDCSTLYAWNKSLYQNLVNLLTECNITVIELLEICKHSDEFKLT